MIIETTSNEEIAKILEDNLSYMIYDYNIQTKRYEFKEKLQNLCKDTDKFFVVCDETNNPPSIIDNNEFVCDIYVKRFSGEYHINGLVDKFGPKTRISVKLMRLMSVFILQKIIKKNYSLKDGKIL